MAGIVARMPDAGYELLQQAVASNSSGGRRQARHRRAHRAGGHVRRRRRRRGLHHARASGAFRRKAPSTSAAAASTAARDNYLPLQGQPGRRHADHLRQQLADVPDVHLHEPGQRHCPPRAGGAARSTGSTASSAATTATSTTSCYIILIYFFCYFWTAITFNPEGHGRQPQGLRHLHPRLSARQAHRRLPGKGDDANHLRRGRLPGRRRHHSDAGFQLAGRELQ